MEKTEGAKNNGQSRETGNIGYTRYKTKTNKTKQKHNTICVGHYYMQTNTNNVNKT
jgi:quinolinate synthase